MAPVRKGDGTSIKPTDYQQIRKGDGTVLFDAIPDSVIENFNDIGDGTEAGVYQAGDDLNTFYRMDTSDSPEDIYKRTTAKTAIGDHALTVTDVPNRTFFYSLPGDGLNYYPENGDIFSCFVRLSSNGGGDNLIAFGVSDSDNNFRPDITQGGDLRLSKVDNGTFQSLATAGTSTNTSTWYDLEVEWDSPDIEIRLYSVDSQFNRQSQLQSISASSSKYSTNRGIGFRSNSGDDVEDETIWDGYRVIDKGGANL